MSLRKDLAPRFRGSSLNVYVKPQPIAIKTFTDDVTRSTYPGFTQIETALGPLLHMSGFNYYVFPRYIHSRKHYRVLHLMRLNYNNLRK